MPRKPSHPCHLAKSFLILQVSDTAFSEKSSLTPWLNQELHYEPLILPKLPPTHLAHCIPDAYFFVPSSQPATWAESAERCTWHLAFICLLGCSFKTAPKVSQSHAWAEALTASMSTLSSCPALAASLSPLSDWTSHDAEIE